MTTLVFNLVEVNVLIIILFLVLILIKSRLTFQQQRFAIISTPIVALGVVCIKSFVDYTTFGYTLPIVELNEVVVNENGSGTEQITSIVNYLSLRNIYIAGVVLFGLFSWIKLLKLFLFFRRNQSIKDSGYYLYNVPEKASFSFFNYIQIDPNLEGEDREIILEHEQVHAKKLHSFDLLLVEVFHVLFWFNPVFIWMKRELINLHEYEVDTTMFKRHHISYMKFLVNYALGTNCTNYLLTSRFYNRLTIKKRIKIMKSKSKTKSTLLLVLPLVAILFGGVQCQKIDIEEKGSGVVYEEADIYPEFQGGTDAMVAYIQKNVEYPKKASEVNAEGTVFVQFVVSKRGSIKEPMVMKSVHPDLDAEALRVVSEMPKWKPGKKDGKLVAVKYTIPISFKLK